jgi:hypothetical protein
MCIFSSFTSAGLIIDEYTPNEAGHQLPIAIYEEFEEAAQSRVWGSVFRARRLNITVSNDSRKELRG